MNTSLSKLCDFQLGYVHGLNSQWNIYADQDIQCVLIGLLDTGIILANIDALRFHQSPSILNLKLNSGPASNHALVRLLPIVPDKSILVTSYGDIIHRNQGGIYSVISAQVKHEHLGLVTTIPKHIYNWLNLYQYNVPETKPLVDRCYDCFSDLNKPLCSDDNGMYNNDNLIWMFENTMAYNDISDTYTYGFVMGSEYIDYAIGGTVIN